MRQEITALMITIVAAIIITLLAVVIIRQKRREKWNEQADIQDVTPPVLTVTLASSNFTDRLDVQDGRPGLNKSLSEASGLDVWELRQENRRQYIIDNIIYKTVECKLRNFIELPHISVLSERSTAESRTNGLIRHPTDCDQEYIRSLSDDGGQLDIETGIQEYIRPRKGTLYTTDTSTEISSAEVSAQSTVLHSYTHRSCPICAEDYKEGDNVCWSKNEDCAHAFHLDCNVAYLLNTNECILCRNEFLAKNTPRHQLPVAMARQTL